MSTEHLSHLDAFATKATGKPVKVYIGDDLDGALGQATYAPMYKCHLVWLHRSILPGAWRQDQLTRIFFHELGHIAAGHCNPRSNWHPLGLPRKDNPAAHRIISTPLGQALLSQREEEADTVGGAIRNSFPIKLYSVSKLIQGREIFTP